MASCRCSAAAVLAVLLATGVAAKVTVVERSGELVLRCDGVSDHVNWSTGSEGKELNLGRLSSDPRGIYSCWERNKRESKDGLQVYVRMCENCIDLDPGTISGIVVADVIITVLIAVAVYCVSGSEGGRASRASDKQVLIANDQLYQPLKKGEASEYSQISGSRPRRK
ncbi:T-cell surface glycoprotein CD3 delta chain-like [Ambystoma mexicanum]|uniref:T-cell surface glycoprotein CD3 delta chain-like n=1 Tax=Ambystoma mexicanum TaxID=8296 RepID=UPI0037E7474A